MTVVNPHQNIEYFSLGRYADDNLNRVAAELDSFDGRKDPERCAALVSRYLYHLLSVVCMRCIYVRVCNCIYMRVCICILMRVCICIYIGFCINIFIIFYYIYL